MSDLPQEAIQAAAKMRHSRSRPDRSWDELMSTERDQYRQFEREYLQAAAPYIAAQERERLLRLAAEEIAKGRQFVLSGNSYQQQSGSPLSEREIVDGLIVVNRGVVTRIVAALIDSDSLTPEPVEEAGKKCDCGNWYHDAPCECGDALKAIEESAARDQRSLRTILEELPAALAALPPELREHYEASERSIIKARAAANANEGRNVVGATHPPGEPVEEARCEETRLGYDLALKAMPKGFSDRFEEAVEAFARSRFEGWDAMAEEDRRRFRDYISPQLRAALPYLQSVPATEGDPAGVADFSCSGVEERFISDYINETGEAFNNLLVAAGNLLSVREHSPAGLDSEWREFAAEVDAARSVLHPTQPAVDPPPPTEGDQGVGAEPNYEIDRDQFGGTKLRFSGQTGPFGLFAPMDAGACEVAARHLESFKEAAEKRADELEGEDDLAKLDGPEPIGLARAGWQLREGLKLWEATRPPSTTPKGEEA